MSRILNEDVLIDILSELKTEDLFRLSRVSQQFQHCSEPVLKMKKKLVIRNNCICFDKNHLKDSVLDMTALFRSEEFLNSDTFFIMSLILEKCPNIVCVQLSGLPIESYHFQLANEFIPRMNCLYFDNCQFKSHFGQSLQSIEQLTINTPNLDIDDSEEELEEIFAFIGQLTHLKRFALISKLNRELEEYVEVILSVVPQTIDWLLLIREFSLKNNVLEHWIDLNSFHSVKHLYIESYRISRNFLLAINETMDLIGFGFNCRHIDWNVLDQISGKQNQLKTLYMWKSTFQTISDYIPIEYPFESVTKLYLHRTLFRSTITEYQCFLKCFPNLQTLIYTKSGVLCKKPNKPFTKCQTCYNLTFDPFFRELSSVNKLVIREEDIQPIFNVLFTYSTNVKQIVIKRNQKFQTEDHLEIINWRITQIVMIFIRLSERQANKVFTIRISRQLSSLNLSQLIIPKNLLIKQIISSNKLYRFHS